MARFILSTCSPRNQPGQMSVRRVMQIPCQRDGKNRQSWPSKF